MYFLDDTANRRGSDAKGSPSQGDSFGNGTSKKPAPFRAGLNMNQFYNGSNMDGVSYNSKNMGKDTDSDVVSKGSVNAGKQIDPDVDPSESVNAEKQINPQTESYPSDNSVGAPSNLDKQYSSINESRFADTESRGSTKLSSGFTVDEAKKMMARTKAQLAKRPTKLVGEKLLGNKMAFADNSPENRERVKQQAKDKTKGYLKDKLGDKIGDKIGDGAKKGFKKGLEKGAGKALKTGAKGIGKEGIKALGKGGIKAGAQAVTKGVQSAISAAGVGSAPETFGLGLILSFLLNIAISLGLNDAIDAGFELAAGNLKQAGFLAIRAAIRVLMFFVLLIDIGLVFSIGGVIIGLPLLVVLNIYMVLGWFLPSIPHLQGFAKWEMAIILFLDFWVITIIIGFLGGLAFSICSASNLTSWLDWDSWFFYFADKSPLGVVFNWIVGVNVYDAMLQVCKVVDSVK